MLRTLGAVALVVCATAGVGAAEQPESTYARGVAAYRSGAYAQAISFFDQVVDEKPHDAAALYYRGLSRARAGQYAEAIPDLEEAAQDLPDVPVAADLGVANYYAGRRAEATRWLQQAAQNRNGGAGANLLLGIMAYEDGDLATAQRFFAEADAAGDSRVKGTASYYLGLIAVRNSRPADARSSFEQAQAAGEPAVAQAAAGYLSSLGSPTGTPAVGAAMTSPAAGGTAGVSSLGPFSLHAAAGFQYDSNVLIANIPLSQRSALPFSDKKDDGRFSLGAGATYTVLADERALLQFSYDFYQSLFFSVDRLDLQGHTLSGVFEYGDGIVVPGLQGGYSLYLTDGTSTYLSRAWASPYAVIQEEGLGQTEVFYTITADDYLGAPFNPYRDGNTNAVGARQTFFLGSPDRKIDVGYQWYKIDTGDGSLGAADFDDKSNQVDVGASFFVPQVAWFEARWLFSNDNYLNGNSRSAPVKTVQPDGTITLSRLRRRDDRNVVQFLVTRDLPAGLYASLGYQFSDGGSNIPVFDYSRSIVSATLGMIF